MAARPNRKKAPLTDYQRSQVEQIAAWKSLPPDPLTELWSIIARPLARLVGALTPDRLVEIAIEKADDLAALVAGQDDIKRRMGVDSLEELRQHSLEDCDRMAGQTGFGAQLLATVEGAATGAGGVWTTLLDVPLLIVLALRTIRKIGHCYGYPLDDERGRKTVLGILLAGMSGSLQTRRERLGRLRELEDLVVAQSEEEVVVQEVLSLLFQLEIFEEIPGIGAITGALLNVTFMKRIDIAARRIFQEKRLMDSGKVREIEPAFAPDHVLAEGLTGALGGAACSGMYAAGFAVALPGAIVSTALRPAVGRLSRAARNVAGSGAGANELALGRRQGNGRPTSGRSVGRRMNPALAD